MRRRQCATTAYLVLLRISTADDEVVVGADEPVELFEPQRLADLLDVGFDLDLLHGHASLLLGRFQSLSQAYAISPHISFSHSLSLFVYLLDGIRGLLLLDLGLFLLIKV